MSALAGHLATTCYSSTTSECHAGAVSGFGPLTQPSFHCWCCCYVVSCLQLVDQSGFKDEHLCWGQVQDMTLFDRIVTLPRRNKKPGEMNE
jgi:hypothetical protein